MDLKTLLLDHKYNNIIIFFMIIILIVFGIVLFINDLFDDNCGDGNDDCTYAYECETVECEQGIKYEDNDIDYSQVTTS
jgi:hypothetical protein